VVTDLTRQKRDERMLAEERLSRSIVEQTADIMVVCDDQGRVTRVSRTALDLIGRNCLHEPFDEAFHLRVNPASPASPAEWADYVPFTIQSIISGVTFHSREAFVETKGVPSKHLLLSAVPLLDRDQQAVGAIVNLADITEKKDYERRLQESEAWLKTTLRSIGDAVITTDEKGRVSFLNPVAEALTGWDLPSALGKPIVEVFHIINEHTRERADSPVDIVLAKGIVVGLANHTALVARDGTERIIADSGAPIRNEKNDIIGVVLAFRDITERVRLEEELLKNRQLESLGVLAGGIAHDFNNIIAIILGNVCLARDLVPPGEADDLLGEVLNASTRAQALTRQLLTFAKGGAPVKETASIREVLRESAAFVLRGSKSLCEFSIADDLWTAEVDVGQLSQVMNNLVINADQAMPQGGRIQVAAENCLVRVTDGLPIRPGRYLRITVTDQGLGIDQRHLSRIFDPYFTTKQKGSGLGLATTFSVIKKHDGHITASSRPGAGTTFTIYLPATDQLVSKKPETNLLRGKGRILVMDDEEPLQRMLKQVLTRLGYESKMAGNGDEAIKAYGEAMDSGRPFDAVILDLTIPGAMGGREAIQELLKIDPEIKAIVASGYSDDPVLGSYKAYGFRGRIAKPFDLKDLSRVLHEVITEKTD
jgi:two-component system, cell cycle sensor histidine kinase and response regulator CckA